mmetsp:Transcript_45027/g.79242  ORF Transcript_45027/g.79242 Transcript_45027/m.79242 type:complete len:210 (+) Transcript_45027:51-680(+)
MHSEELKHSVAQFCNRQPLQVQGKLLFAATPYLNRSESRADARPTKLPQLGVRLAYHLRQPVLRPLRLKTALSHPPFLGQKLLTSAASQHASLWEASAEIGLWRDLARTSRGRIPPARERWRARRRPTFCVFSSVSKGRCLPCSLASQALLAAARNQQTLSRDPPCFESARCVRLPTWHPWAAYVLSWLYPRFSSVDPRCAPVLSYLLP